MPLKYPHKEFQVCLESRMFSKKMTAQEHFTGHKFSRENNRKRFYYSNIRHWFTARNNKNTDSINLRNFTSVVGEWIYCLNATKILFHLHLWKVYLVADNFLSFFPNLRICIPFIIKLVLILSTRIKLILKSVITGLICQTVQSLFLLMTA